MGRCELAATPFCDPALPGGNGANLCPAGSFCARTGVPGEVSAGLACLTPPRLNPPVTTRGVCQRALLEGERCDSDWTTAQQARATGVRAFCRACAPGLVCWNQVCRRTCRPGEGGIGNCVPDEQTANFNTLWSCEEQTGRFFPSERSALEPLCTVCTPHRTTCEIPPEFAAQSSNPARNVCCDPLDVCVPPLDVNGRRQDRAAECCRPATFQGTNGGVCTRDEDCCGVFALGLRFSRCCTSPDQQGCRPENVGRCGGCGPGTGVSCCSPDGRGCRANEACVGRGDEARCVPCGADRQPCCQGSNGKTCDGGLTCFDHPELPAGHRCERCGEAGEQCCPGNLCAGGHACVGGFCQPCGESNEICCEGRRCATRFHRCQGPGTGTCAQICGAIGQDCCGERGGSFTGPRRPLCLDDRAECDGSFVCRHCGANGELGCGGSPVCDAGLGFSPTAGTCGPCGRRDQPCCAAEPRCFEDGEGTSCAGDGFCRRPPG